MSTAEVLSRLRTIERAYGRVQMRALNRQKNRIAGLVYVVVQELQKVCTALEAAQADLEEEWEAVRRFVLNITCWAGPDMELTDETMVLVKRARRFRKAFGSSAGSGSGASPTPAPNSAAGRGWGQPYGRGRGGGVGGMQCYTCGGFGHRAVDCPSPGRPGAGKGGRQGKGKGGPIICHKCGQPGHIRANCPLNSNRTQSNGAGTSATESERS